MQKRRRICVPLLLLLTLAVPTVAQSTGQQPASDRTNSTAYRDAVATASTPASYDQAVMLFKAVGPALALGIGLILLVLLLSAGVAGYWTDTGFWAVYFLVLCTAAATLVGIPYLWTVV